jgi:hypothetical protein
VPLGFSNFPIWLKVIGSGQMASRSFASFSSCFALILSCWYNDIGSVQTCRWQGSNITMPYAWWSNGVQTRRFPFSLSLSLCLIVEEAQRKIINFS